MRQVVVPMAANRCGELVESLKKNRRVRVMSVKRRKRVLPLLHYSASSKLAVAASCSILPTIKKHLMEAEHSEQFVGAQVSSWRVVSLGRLPTAV